MNFNKKTYCWVILLTISCLFFYKQSSSGFHIETNILKLLPQTEQDPIAEIAFEKFSDKTMQQILLLVAHEQESKVIQAAKTAHNILSSATYIESFNSDLSPQQQQEIGKLYFNYRHHLLSEDDQKVLVNQGESYFSETSLQLLFSPLSGKLAQLMQQDPYLLSYRFTQSLSQAINNSQIKDQTLIINANDQFYAVISAQLNASAFNPQTQQLLNQDLQNIQNTWDAENLNVQLLKTGAIFYAEKAINSAKSEISTIGLGSLIAILVFLIVAFRSTKPLLLTAIALGFGVSLAFSTVHFIFGQVHILTLVFGSSLVGVAVDYAFHYFASINDHKKPLPFIFNAITLGVISSIIGYLAMYSAPFPGLRQIALFCCVGLLGAYATVVLLFDSQRLTLRTPSSILNSCNHFLNFGKYIAQSHLRFIALLIPIIAIILVIKAPSTHDNIRHLQATNPELINQEQQIKTIMQSPAANQFFVIKANDQESLLQKNELLAKKLVPLIEQKIISGFSSISQWVPSQQTQSDNYQLFKQHLFNNDLATFVDSGLLNNQQVQQIQNDFNQSKNNYLHLQEWLDSPIGKKMDHLWLGQINNDWVSIVTLQNIQNLSALISLEIQNSDIYFVNKVQKVSDLFQDYRLLAAKVLVIAILLITIILALKYHFTSAMLIVLAPVLAICIAIIVSLVFGLGLNLFNTLALFLILGIGIDYGLFYAESNEAKPSTVLAITLSAFTTLLSFGLLSLSETPALHSFGLTMLSGIFSVFILSPVIGTLIQKSINHRIKTENKNANT